MRLPPLALALALLAPTSAALAQPVEVPARARLGDAPSAPGAGAPAMAVLAFFSGFPSDLRDARDLLDGRSVAPAFHAWCGVVPYVDFTNGQVLDSFGRQSPTALCLPFLDPARQGAPHSCRTVEGLPTGRYHQGGGLALRVEGGLALRRAGTYTLAWGHDDGVGFSFADATVFEFRDPTGSRVDRRAVRVAEPGLYLFTLEWFDTIGGALLDWYIAEGDATEGPLDARFRLVGADDLYAAGSIPCTPDCARCPADAPRCDWGRGRCVADHDAGADAGDDVRDADVNDAPETPRDVAAEAAVDAPDGGGTAAPAGGCACRAGARRRRAGVGFWAAGAMALARRRRRRRR